jgi:hypothetical protein
LEQPHAQRNLEVQEVMLKCPFCSFDNEDGVLFCEQCKSDLSGVEAVMMASPVAAAQEPPIPLASPLGSSAIPMAEPPIPEALPLATAEPVALATPPADLPTATPMAEPIPEAKPMPEAAPMTMPPVAPAAAMAATPDSPTTAPAQAAPEAVKLPPGAAPKLLVIRGQKINAEYPLYEGLNFIGRADEKPVDIDLEDQEPPDRIWSSRQHACISYENGELTIEDLNSSNGTFVNRARIYPGQKRGLSVNDVVQIGTVQMRVKA